MAAWSAALLSLHAASREPFTLSGMHASSLIRCLWLMLLLGCSHGTPAGVWALRSACCLAFDSSSSSSSSSSSRAREAPAGQQHQPGQVFRRSFLHCQQVHPQALSPSHPNLCHHCCHAVLQHMTLTAVHSSCCCLNAAPHGLSAGYVNCAPRNCTWLAAVHTTDRLSQPHTSYA